MLVVSVMSGKLSEGINFSDDLARCIAVIGMPYPNSNNLILKEKMKLLSELSTPPFIIVGSNFVLENIAANREVVVVLP